MPGSQILQPEGVTRWDPSHTQPVLARSNETLLQYA